MRIAILIIAPHPDDETLGAGGTIALHTHLGYPTYVLCLTGSKTRIKELQKAAKILGVKKAIAFEGDDFTVNYQMIPKIVDIIQDFRPKIIIAPHPKDYHRDHRLTLDIVVESIEWASHVTLSDSAWRVKRLYLMEGHNLITHPHIYVNITNHFNKKLEAIEAYTSQTTKFHGRKYYQEFVEAKARLRGVQSGVKYSEAYQIHPLAKHGLFYQKNVLEDLLKEDLD